MPETLNSVPGSRNATVRKSRTGIVSPEQLAPALLLLISLVLFLFLVHLTEGQQSIPVDRLAFKLLDRWQNQSLTRIVSMLTLLGTGTFLIPVYVLLVVRCVRQQKQFQAGMVIAFALSSVVLGWLLKPVFHRPRPVLPLVAGAGGSSFPSGHALGAFTLSILVLFLIKKSSKPLWIKIIVSVMAILFGCVVALTRVYLHVHYATDLAGSLVIAAIWAIFMYFIFFVIYKPESNRL